MAGPPKAIAKKVYDVAVLGPDVGGAAAAALSARRGLRTLRSVVLLPLVLPGMLRDRTVLRPVLARNWRLLCWRCVRWASRS